MKSFGKEHRLLREETGTCPGHSTAEIYREEQCFPLVLHQQYKSIIEAEGGILPLKALLYHSAKCSELSQRSKRRPQLGKLMWSLRKFCSFREQSCFLHTQTLSNVFYFIIALYLILFYFTYFVYTSSEKIRREKTVFLLSLPLLHTHTHTHTHSSETKKTSREHCMSELSKISEKL